jgi:hypothetical protein
MRAFWFLLLGVGLASAAHADSTPDKSGFTFLNATPDSDLRSFCTDRPTKYTMACTVDAGHWQIESDFFNGSSDHTYAATDPTIKYGLTNTVDVELNVIPVEIVAMDHKTTTGVGDTFAKLKWNLLGDDSGDIAVALEPYVKIPTARHTIGNGAVEEGLILPVTANLPSGWVLVVDPEADSLKDQNGSGYHLNYSGIVNVSHAITKTTSFDLEYWSDVNRDPINQHESSVDIGFMWNPSNVPNLQLDAGFDVGLTRETPSLIYQVGFAKRF